MLILIYFSFDSLDCLLVADKPALCLNINYTLNWQHQWTLMVFYENKHISFVWRNETFARCYLQDQKVLCNLGSSGHRRSDLTNKQTTTTLASKTAVFCCFLLRDIVHHHVDHETGPLLLAFAVYVGCSSRYTRVERCLTHLEGTDEPRSEYPLVRISSSGQGLLGR